MRRPGRSVRVERVERESHALFTVERSHALVHPNPSLTGTLACSADPDHRAAEDKAIIPLVRIALKGRPEEARDERRTYLGQKRRQTGGILGLLAARLRTGRRLLSCLELIDDLDGRFRSEVLLSIATLEVRSGVRGDAG